MTLTDSSLTICKHTLVIILTAISDDSMNSESELADATINLLADSRIMIEGVGYTSRIDSLTKSVKSIISFLMVRDR